ncbi:hypothetical protein A2U01_0105141, partial [Trifolium medium]|nr:hypothetical protein [Trifolium medium]
MSQTSDASQINIEATEIVKTRSKSKQRTSTVTVDAKPISTVPSTDSKQKSTKSKASKKKEKPT